MPRTVNGTGHTGPSEFKKTLTVRGSRGNAGDRSDEGARLAGRVALVLVAGALVVRRNEEWWSN